MQARAHEKVDAAAAAHQRHASRVDLVEQKAASRCVFSAFHLIHTPHCCRPLLPLSLHQSCAQSASPWTSAPSFASLAALRLRSARLRVHWRTSTERISKLHEPRFPPPAACSVTTALRELTLCHSRPSATAAIHRTSWTG